MIPRPRAALALFVFATGCAGTSTHTETPALTASADAGVDIDVAADEAPDTSDAGDGSHEDTESVTANDTGEDTVSNTDADGGEGRPANPDNTHAPEPREDAWLTARGVHADTLPGLECREKRLGAHGPQALECTDADDISVHYGITFVHYVIVDGGQLHDAWTGAIGAGPMYDHSAPGASVIPAFSPDGTVLTVTESPRGACARWGTWIAAHEHRTGWSEWDFAGMARYRDVVCNSRGRYGLRSGSYERAP